MRLLGQLEHGFQDDIYADVDPSVLQQYLDIDTEYSGLPGGAGALFEHSTDAEATGENFETNPPAPNHHEDEYDDLNLGNLSPQEVEVVTFLRQQLKQERLTHVRHAPVAVASHRCPFDTEDMLSTFLEAFSLAKEDNFVPSGYGVLPEEWEGGIYPDEQYIGSERARKQNASLFIPLPHSIWYPRAVDWVIGLHIMSSILDD